MQVALGLAFCERLENGIDFFNRYRSRSQILIQNVTAIAGSVDSYCYW